MFFCVEVPLEGFAWSVGDGRLIKVWTDNWIPEIEPLVNFCRKMDIINLDTTLGEVTLADGRWEWNFWHSMVVRIVVPLIAGIPPPKPFIGQDELVSTWTSNGEFTVKAAYNHPMLNNLNPADYKWKLTWSFEGPQSIRQFLRLVLKEHLLTNAERYRRGMVGSPSCSLCDSHEESVIHILRDCRKARAIWNQVIPSNCAAQFFLFHYYLGCH